MTFPPATLAPYEIETQLPDDFFCDQLALVPGLVCSALRKVRSRQTSPPKTVEEYLAVLTRQGLVATLAELEPFAELL